MKDLDLKFADEYEFAELLSELIGNDLAVFADYEYISELIKALLVTDEEYHLECIDLDSQCGTHVLEIDPDMGIWVCQAKGLTAVEDDIYFVHQDVSSKFLKLVNEDYHAFDFNKYDGNCDNCNKYSEDDRDIVTHTGDNSISQTWSDGKGSYFSRSFISSNNKILDEIIEEWTDFANRF